MTMDDSLMVPVQQEEAMEADPNAPGPLFAPLRPGEVAVDHHSASTQYRKVPIPPHRLTPLKQVWLKIYGPLTENLRLQVRMHVKARCVELRSTPETPESGSVQKGADFVRAFALGFEVEDALALLRLDDLYIDTFEVKDVKTLNGDHLARAIGRLAGKSGKTKFTIENATRTRIVLADTRIHILGSFQNIRLARDACVRLILGSPPGKVYTQLRSVASRLREHF